jgi:hypothetical protein
VTRRRREGEKVSSFVIFCHFFQGVEEEAGGGGIIVPERS